MKKDHLVMFSVIRNGIQNGYPFVEAYGSWLDYCDRIVVLDGCSTDGTDIVLARMAELNDKFEYLSSPWPETSVGGSAIADFTNQALELARDRGEFVLYIQADEIVSRQTRTKIRQRKHQDALMFTRYVLFWNSFYQVIVLGDSPAPSASDWPAIRLFPADSQAKSMGDGLSFDVKDLSICGFDEQILHYGWCFPINILQKHMNHVKLYPENRRYRKRAKLAAKMLENRNYNTRLLETLDPEYLSKRQSFAGRHPGCIQHLLAQTCYDPYVGLNLLGCGVKW